MRISSFLFVVATWGTLPSPPQGVVTASSIIAIGSPSPSSFVHTLPVPSSPRSGGRRRRRPRDSATSEATSSREDDVRHVEIPIIFENDRLLAVEKPHGIPHHDDPSTGELGIMSLLRDRRRSPSSSSSFACRGRLYGVHRLDRVTSGILLLAKDPATAGLLASKFRTGEITKFYVGMSGRRPRKGKQGWVRGTMTRGRRGCYRLLNNDDDVATRSRAEEGDARRTALGGMRANGDIDDVEVGAVDDDDYDDDGRRGGQADTRKGGGNVGYAVTRFYTAGLGNLSFHPSLLVDDGPNPMNDDRDDDGGRRGLATMPRTAMLFRPHTGKTHQLRVAAKSLAMPILGDVRYGGGRLLAGGVSSSSPPPDSGDDEDRGDWDRTYLHASALHFEFDEHEIVTIWSPPPFDRLATGLNDVFVRMMEKHCDCPPILDAIHKRSAMNEK